MDSTPHVYRPPPRAARARALLGIVLTVVVAGVALLVTALFWMPHSLAYTIDGESLSISATPWPVATSRVVPLASIQSAGVVTLEGGLRTGGTAVPGLCSGWFRYPDLGSVWQATDCSRRVVLIDAGMDRLLVSPSNSEVFLEQLRLRKAGSFVPPPAPPTPNVLALLPILMWVLAGVLALSVLVAPSRIVYAVSPEFVEIRALLGSRCMLTKGLVARRHRPKLGLRLAGTALPGYYSGWFRMDGKNTLLRATDVTDGVLLEGQRRVFINPADPEAFLADLRTSGATVVEPSAA